MRRLLLALALLVSTTGCLGGRDLGISADELAALALARSSSVHQFRSTTVVGGQRLVVDGLVEDDYRYSASVTIDGRPAYDEVVADDRRYVRVRSAELLLPADALSRLRMSTVAARVLGGGWVLDPFGAPEEFTSGRTLAEVPLSPRLVLDRVRLLEGLPETVKSGFRAYSKVAIYYLPQDDKFPEYKADGSRFDKVPLAYDTTATTVTVEDLRRYFEYVSVWAKRDGLTRVERLLQLPDRRDRRYAQVYEQIGRAGSSRLQALVAAGADAGRLTESYLSSPAKAGAAVVEPKGAQRLDLTAVVNAVRAVAPAASSPSPLYGPLV